MVMPTLNLLYVITKLELGGAQTQLLCLAGGIDKREFRPRLAASPGTLSGAFSLLEGVIPEKVRFLVRPVHPLKDLCALVELAFLMRRRGIQIVHTHSSKAGTIGRLAARLAGVKVIIHTVHGWSFNDRQPRPVRGLYVFFERVCAGFSDAIIAVSEHDRQTGLSLGIGGPDRYELIRYGIDFSRYPRGDREYLKRSFGLAAEDKVVCMVGCFKPQKAPLDFIRAAAFVSARFPSARFLLVGDGSMRPAIERAVRRSGLQGHVILTGWRYDLPELLAGTDVFVLTSLWEGLPVSALEALKSGVPVIATDTGGIREAVADGVNGYIVPRSDPQAMSGRICGLLLDETLRMRMARNAAHSLDSGYSLGTMLSDTQNLYRRKIREKTGDVPIP
jgi:glycosyltransferase involved in cell wall biosynthesis